MEKQRVKKNWAKVRSILLKNIIPQNKAAKYQLFPRIQDSDSICRTVKYCISGDIIYSYIPHPKIEKISSGTNNGIDTTGIWLWEAEEILAYFLINKSEIFCSGKKVLELGAGSSGFAGIICSKFLKASSVLITDGLQDNIQYLEKSIQTNSLKNKAYADVLIWGQKKISQKFDLIILADCLFFQKYHQSLIETFRSNLEIDGKVISVSPKRGKSLQNFVNHLSQSQFQYQLLQFNEQLFKEKVNKVKDLKNYDEDQDQYYFLKIQFKKPYPQ